MTTAALTDWIFFHCEKFLRSHFHHCLVFCSWQQAARLSILLNRPLSNRKKRVLLNRLIMIHFFVAGKEKGTRLRIEASLFKPRKKVLIDFQMLQDYDGHSTTWWCSVASFKTHFLLSQKLQQLHLRKLQWRFNYMFLFCPQMIPNLRCWLKPER